MKQSIKMVIQQFHICVNFQRENKSTPATAYIIRTPVNNILYL